jgi:hypothetical protein
LTQTTSRAVHGKNVNIYTTRGSIYNPQINELRIFFPQNPSLDKLKGMLSLCNVTLYRKICGFIRKIIKYL